VIVKEGSIIDTQPEEPTRKNYKQADNPKSIWFDGCK
jgi:hypothetical protein